MKRNQFHPAAVIETEPTRGLIDVGVQHPGQHQIELLKAAFHLESVSFVEHVADLMQMLFSHPIVWSVLQEQ